MSIPDILRSNNQFKFLLYLFCSFATRILYIDDDSFFSLIDDNSSLQDAIYVETSNWILE